MAFIGNTPTAVPLTGSQIADGTIINANIATNTINLTQKVTATLPYAQGGTGLSTLGTAGQALVVNSSATALSYATVGATAGQVIQVASTNKVDTFTMSTTTFTDITNLSVSITPSSASNKILVMASLGIIGTGTNFTQGFFRMVRDSTNILIPSSAGNRTLCNFAVMTTYSDSNFSGGYHILDTPNTTSATIYKVQCSAESGVTLTINRTGGDADVAEEGRGTCTITVMEIKG